MTRNRVVIAALSVVALVVAALVAAGPLGDSDGQALAPPSSRPRPTTSGPPEAPAPAQGLAGAPGVTAGGADPGSDAATAPTDAKPLTPAPAAPGPATPSSSTPPGTSSGVPAPGSGDPWPPGPPASPPAVAAGPTETSPSPTAPTQVAPETGKRWVPPASVSWHWLLDHPLDLSSASDMGTGRRDSGGGLAADPLVYDVDGFTNPAITVERLHAAGKRVVCYIETGGWENYRPDAGQFPSTVLGRTISGYPDERYLDIRSPIVVGLIKARVKMCADKGFDAVEPDIDDSYAENTGFPITLADNLDFNRSIAQYAHSLGLSIALKNGDEPAFAAAMEPHVDFVLTEQCFEFDTCDSYRVFTRAGKAVLAVEYDLEVSEFCGRAQTLTFNAIKYDVDLAGGGTPCR